MKSLRILGAGVALIALAASASHAGEFVDTRLVFIAGDDDFMNDAGRSVPPSQQFDIGDRAGYDEFYDERDSSESGRESRTHLVLHKAVEGYFPGLLTEAALVMEFNHSRILTGDPRAIQDDGTYLRAAQKFDDAGQLSLLLMPFSSDRMRLGWFWDISWGGDHVFPTADLTPGLEIEWASKWYDVHVGAKTGRMQFVTDDNDPRNGQIEAFYGVFGGFGVGQKSGGLRFEAEAGFFEKGRNPNGPVRGERVDAGGVSARLSYHSDLPFLPTNDTTRLYSADVRKPWNHPEQWAPGLRWRAAAEGTWLAQVLEDVDKVGGTTLDAGIAAALYGRVEAGANQVDLHVIHRDLGFLFFDHPGVRRFQALPDDVDVTPEIVASAGYQRHLRSLHLTLGLQGGVQLPASVSDIVPRSGINAPEIRQGRQTIVYRRADMFDDTGLLTGTFLPPGEDVLLVYGGRFHAQLDLAEGFALIGQITVLHDSNRVQLDQDTLGVNSVRVFDDPTTVGAALMARAEF